MDIKIYKKAIAFMADKGLTGVNRLAIAYNDGVVKHMESTNCSASLRSYGGKGNIDCILSGIMREGEKEEFFIPFINWLTKRSPYADAFISKQASKVGKDKCLIISPNCPSNIMIGGIIAARATYENPHIAKGWMELTNRGVNENLAFMLSHWASFGAGTVGFRRSSQNHYAVQANNIDKDYVKAFVTNSPVKTQPTYQEKAGYSNIQNTWGDVTRECYLAPFFSKIKYTEEKTNNVFACALPNNNDKTTSIDNGFNQLAVLAKEIMKDTS